MSQCEEVYDFGDGRRERCLVEGEHRIQPVSRGREAVTHESKSAVWFTLREAKRGEK